MEKSDIAIVVDSATDVPLCDIERYGMYVAPLQVNYSDGSSYLDKLTITTQEVCNRFSEEIPRTSTPTPALVREVLDRVVSDGYRKAVIVAISSGLSSTYELMRSVAAGVPNLESVVIDTKNIGMGAGLCALAVARMVAAGETLAAIKKASIQIVKNTKVFFCVDTLEYLHRGGRIGNVTYAVGSMLDMRPIISCNSEGLYYTVSKARGRKQSLKKAISCAEKFAEKFPACIMAVVHGGAIKEASSVLSDLKSRVDNADSWFEGTVSPALVVHTGPGLIGIGVQGLPS